MRDLKDILSSGSASIVALLQEAYDAGLASGKASAESDLKARVATLFELSPVEPTTATATATDHGARAATPKPADLVKDFGTALAQGSQRAAPGTVKPQILKLITDHPLGFSTEELIAVTGFKPNSVRGTLSTLQSEGAIGKVEGVWATAQWILTEGAKASPKENPGGDTPGPINEAT
jgi:hypothetical protein